MNIAAVINLIYQCVIIFFGIIAIIAIAYYAANASKEPEKAEEEIDDKYFKRLEGKLDLVLKMHGCEVFDEIIERHSVSMYDKLLEMNDKLDVLLCGPMDEETLKELRAAREDKS